jgi:hypothetical protein
MAIIQSGASTALWTIDSTSTAGRTTLYDQDGNVMSDVNSLGNILNALNSNITIVLGGQATLGINVSGTSGTLTVAFEATIDNGTWFAISATPVAGGATVTSTSADGQWIASTSGYYAVRIRVSAFTSGSMTVSIVITPGQSKTGAQVITAAGALEVTGSSNAGSGASTGLITVQGNAGGTPIPITGMLTASTDGYATTSPPTYSNNTFQPLSLTTAGALRTDSSATTQPVSGTITANQGLSTTLSQAWPIELTDGYGNLIASNNPIYVQIVSPPASVLTDIAVGKIAMTGPAANYKFAVRRSTYNEPTGNAQRSIASSSSNDTSSGSGAQQVTITYLSYDMTIRNTETVTLNGSTPVSTVNTNICYIEKMIVTAVGSDGSNDGTITLYGSTGGSGGTVAQILVDVPGSVVGIGNRTYYAHHYVQSGKTCSIVTFDGGTQGTQNAEMFLSSTNPYVSGTPDVQISDSITIGLNAATVPRPVQNTIKMPGPARITLYCIPAGNNTTFYGSFDFYEE